MFMTPIFPAIGHILQPDTFFNPPPAMTVTRHCISHHDVVEARRRIVDHVVRTPMLDDESLSRQFGLDLRLKAENLQRTGSFKARGATNAVMTLSDDQIAGGIVTHSSGNHAAAVARAGGIRGVATHVIMPENSSPAKVANVRSFGVEPAFCLSNAQSRQESADRHVAATGATLVHPYDDPMTIAGQATTGLEIIEQAPSADAVYVCLGGGGLLSGILIAIKAMRPDTKIYGAEPAWADDASRSLRSGRIEMPTRYDTIADGLRTPLGRYTFDIIRDLVDGIVLVDEDEIVTMRDRLEAATRTKVEPSGAVAAAAIWKARDRHRGQTVVATISGGNVSTEPSNS